MSGGWNTIESDAGVFTYLIESLGVRNLQFEELVSLDSQTLSDLNALGVIFLFKYPTGEKPTDVPKDGNFDYAAVDKSREEGGVWFAAQTIQNACGTQALLSVVLNKDKNEGVEVGGPLEEFREFTGAFPADLRGEALSNSDLIRDAHNSFARSSPFVSDEQRTATDDDDVYHFIAYTAVNGALYELDGLQPAPINHGPCAPTEFADKIIPVLQKRIERYPAHEIRFNLLAMCQDLRTKAREVGDEEMLYREEQKRRQWQWENALRRHNFVGFIGELSKGVVGQQVKEGKYDKWIGDAKDRTKKRLDEARKKRAHPDEMEM